MEKLKKINPKLLVAVVILVVLIIIAIFQIKNYNDDLKQCYVVVKKGLGWNQFQSLINKHSILKSNFEEKAYEELYKAMDEEIERIKNGDYGTEESFNWYNEVDKNKVDKKYKDKIKEKQQLIELYRMINTINHKYIKEENYADAYCELYDISNDYILCDKGKGIAKKELSKIQDKAVKQAIQRAEEKIDTWAPSYSIKFLKPFKTTNNSRILELYKLCEEKEKQAEQQRKEQEQAEERARIEQEKKDFEIYCYFNMIAWKDKSLNDEQAFSRCASKFGITKEQAKESYNRVEPTSYSYQDKYPDIYNKYASQYYN